MVESANRVCQLFEFEIAQSRLTFLRRWPSENMLGGYETLNNRTSILSPPSIDKRRHCEGR